MNVEFYNSKAFKIESADLKEKIFVECESLLGMTLKRGYFPGAQPVTVERKNFEMLKKEEYMVCEKSDGERAVLILININEKPMCFVINRNNELYFMDFSFKKEVFEGSIFDGEIIKTKEGSWNYLIHDCMVYNGTSFMEFSHRLRYACIVDFIIKRYINKKTDCFNIKTKIFYKYGPELFKTWEHINKTTENKIDGLIFTPINENIKFGRDYNLLKWKEEHTVDFAVKKIGIKINLYFIKQGTNVIYKSLSKGTENYDLILTFLNDNLLKKNDKSASVVKSASVIKSASVKEIIIEFKIPKKDYFTPYRLRTDKDKPNGEITVINTLKNVEENIKIEEI